MIVSTPDLSTEINLKSS